MDSLQRYNQRLVVGALRETRLLTAVEATAGRRVRTTSVSWDEYWGQFEEIFRPQANVLADQDLANGPLDAETLRPADLIANGQLSRIQHGMGRFILKNGRGFRQFSLSDYFKAIRVVMGDALSGRGDFVYLPLRAFDEDVLVLPSGRSLIGQLLAMADKLVIEDVDLLPSQLKRHFRQFGLRDCFVQDLTRQAKRRGAAVYLIERKRQEDTDHRTDLSSCTPLAASHAD